MLVYFYCQAHVYSLDKICQSAPMCTVEYIATRVLTLDVLPTKVGSRKVREKICASWRQIQNCKITSFWLSMTFIQTFVNCLSFEKSRFKMGVNIMGIAKTVKCISDYHFKVSKFQIKFHFKICFSFKISGFI